MTCPYITVLERACGRALAPGRNHCDFHGALVRLSNEFPSVGSTRRAEVLEAYARLRNDQEVNR